MRKSIIITISFVVVIFAVVVGCLTISKYNSAEDDSPDKMIERFELALGDEYKKQMSTQVAGTIRYADKEGNEINYHILKTTYYEADSLEISGVNTQALGVLFDPDKAITCTKLKINDWDAALYEFEGLSFLCWTDTPEASYVLEYNPDGVSDEEILKMAESAKTPEK